MADLSGLVGETVPRDLLESVLRETSQPVVVTDEAGRVRFWNHAMTTHSGWCCSEVEGWPIADLAQPEGDDGGSWHAVVAKVRHDGGHVGTWRLTHRSGHTLQVRVAVKACPGHDGEPIHYVALVLDRERSVLGRAGAGQHADALGALRQSEARYRAIVHAAHEGIWAVGPDGATLSANQKLADILGVHLAQVYAGAVPEALRQAHQDLRSKIVREAGRDVAHQELTFTRSSDGEERALSVSVSPLRFDDGTAPGTLLMATDITDVRRTEQALRWQALHDSLTGLANRASFHARFEQAATDRETATDSPLTVLYLDLDNLKLVNDAHGHDVGDHLLREIATRVGKAVRPGDTVARLGGDEFAVLCPDLDERGALALASAITASLGSPVALIPQPVFASVSIGVAVSPPVAPHALLKCADTAMYRAKRAPGLRVCLYDEPGGERSGRTLATVNSVRDALGRDEVELRYQPIVDLASDAMVGIEALIRHTDDRLGAVPAAEFASVAERYGWTADLDRIVMTRACQDFALLRDARTHEHLSYISVNVSPSTPGDRLGDLAAEALRGSNLPASCLMLEVTENTVMEDPETAIRWLEELSGQGIRIAVDDFGTGYSSLGRLHRLPVHVLKIDRSFVQAALVDTGALEITRSIVLLAKTFRLRTVAEGIETREQAEMMRALQCDMAQGYLWSPAVRIDELP